MNIQKKLLYAICLGFASGFFSIAISQNLQAPQNVYFFRSSTPNSLTLYWSDTNQGETDYVIESKLDQGIWEEAARLGPNVESYMLSGFDLSKSRLFRIKAEGTNQSEAFSSSLRVVGTEAKLEVYPEVPGIRNPKDTLISGLTFSMLQDQCPAQPEMGKATRISTFYEVEVRPNSGGASLSTPVYETRPQIRNDLPQNDLSHSGGHKPYGYHGYGPKANNSNRILHSKHWTNFDANEDILVTITLLPTGNLSGPIDINDLVIQPNPIELRQINDSQIELVLPGASTFTRHYRIAMNRKAWAAKGTRGANTHEAPLFIFVNPIHLAPGSAPEGAIKEFNNGTLVIAGSGIHLPENKYRFFGPGENSILRELYIPGDAYMHYGFVFNNDGYAVKVWGRGIYSDEMFDVYVDKENYSNTNPDRTPWASVDCAAGNIWDINPAWEARVGFFNESSTPSTFEGLTNIGSRMGPLNHNGNIRLLDHKDVGYGGGTYQSTPGSKSYYQGCLFMNDDDITYVHREYEMNHCTSYNHRNGPTFQYGWGITEVYDVPVRISSHIAWASDRPNGDGTGKNHGVFNTRLKIGQLKYHNGGLVEDVEVYGQENIVFKLQIWDEGIPTENTLTLFEDKVYKNVTIYEHSRQDNLLWVEQNVSKNQRGFIRFLHFDNLVIEGNQVESIDDGDFFDYNDGALLHTITFFSLPDKVPAPQAGNAPIGTEVKITSSLNEKSVKADVNLPASQGPLCANEDTADVRFEVVDAGGGNIALKAPNGYFVKADPKRYGYVYTIPDSRRGDNLSNVITDEARFIWVDLPDEQFALYSRSMGLYLRVEQNCGPEMPLYAASSTIGEAETFLRDARNKKEEVLPDDFTLYPASPNPFFEQTDLRFYLKRKGDVKLWVFDGAGRKVASLLEDEFRPAGLNSVKFDPAKFTPGIMKTGIYYYQLIFKDREGEWMDVGKILYQP